MKFQLFIIILLGLVGFAWTATSLPANAVTTGLQVPYMGSIELTHTNPFPYVSNV